MSGTTLNDIAEKEIGNDQLNLGEDDYIDEISFNQEEQKESRFNEFASRIFSAETGQGAIDNYIDHPLNFGRSKGLARIIRGVTGIFGNLNLAFIDVLMGVLEFSKEKKGAGINGVSSGGVYRS